MSEIIKCEKLTKKYLKQTVVADANFTINKGSIVGLVGPNGAGKTTIMKMLGGLVMPSEGEITLFGETSEKGLSDARSRISFMIETPYAKDSMSARENLEKQRIQKGIPNKERVDEVLKLVGLSETGKKAVKNFSLGMRQRLGIGIALLSKPELMVLDEPINGLDPEGIVEIRDLLKELNEKEKITIVISSHILSELSLLCTDYIFIQKGHIVKQISAEDMRRECKESYLIKTDNDSLAVTVLSEKLGFSDYEVHEDGIRLYEGLSDTLKISKTLYENGVIPYELHINDANLEDYYLRSNIIM